LNTDSALFECGPVQQILFGRNRAKTGTAGVPACYCD